MKNGLNALLSFGITGLFIFGSIFASQMAQIFWTNKDIWWTPMDKMLPLDKTKTQFVLFISGKSLNEHLAAGTLYVHDNNSAPYRIVAQDIGVCLNNWHAVKDTMLTSALFTAFCTGASLACLIIGFFVLRRKPSPIP
ncbi:MAG: hypothetical protein N3B18_04110 [Desulfobacterota bacterium]|nr:hypothetical protein [Thermodesulfobacteriota bacterium]